MTKITIEKAKLEQWLGVLKYWDVHGKLHQPTEEAITAIKAALAQEQEPIGFVVMENPITPQQRPWVGLTEQERNDIDNYCEMMIGKPAFDAIEAKLKSKNGY